MKLTFLSGVVLVASVLGSRAAQPAPAPLPPNLSPAVLARWQFAGARAIQADTNGVVFHAAWTHATTQDLVRETLDKLAVAAAKVAAPSPVTNTTAHPLLRGTVADGLAAESYAEWRGAPGQAVDWAWAFALPADQAAGAQTNLATWLKEVGIPVAPSPLLEGGSGWQAELGPRLGRVVLVQSGDWTVLAGGSLSTARGFLDRIKLNRRPAPALSNLWVSAELNLARLAPWLQLAQPERWPHVQWSLGGRGENVRLQARLGFKEPPLGTLPAWEIPLATIKEDPARVPLISLVAMRGLAPWIESTAFWKALGLKSGPSQAYIWSQSQLAFHTYYAFQSPDVTNSLLQIHQGLPKAIGTNMQTRGVATFDLDTNRTEVLWKGLPIIVPSLRPAPRPDNQYVFGSFFPMAPGTNPPPQALVSQITTRTNLVFFEWELMNGRIPQWNVLWQVGIMAAGAQDFTYKSAAYKWLSTVGTNLTESGTEVVMESPQVLSLKHTSPLGLNSLGMIALSRWLDNPAFPALERPPAVRPAPRIPQLAPLRSPKK